MPLLPYQKLLYQMLHEQKCILIKKSRGIGVTTFFLYWLAYCCLCRFQSGDRVLIVVGSRIDAAQDLIARFKSLFRRNFPAVYSELSKQGSTYCILNGVKVEYFPSHHVDAMRGYDRVKFILSDESDFYPHFSRKKLEV
jgi:late competence protein required for DNA uptake (superfamily II DNA/RNA helicase)